MACAAPATNAHPPRHTPRRGWPALRPATDIHSPHPYTCRVSLFHRCCRGTDDLHGALPVLHTHTPRQTGGRPDELHGALAVLHTHTDTPPRPASDLRASGRPGFLPTSLGILAARSGEIGGEKVSGPFVRGGQRVL